MSGPVDPGVQDLCHPVLYTVHSWDRKGSTLIERYRDAVDAQRRAQKRQREGMRSEVIPPALG